MTSSITNIHANEEVKYVKAGDTVEVTMNIVGDKNIHGVSYIEGQLMYNKDVFVTPVLGDIVVSDNISDVQLVDDVVILKYHPTTSEDYIKIHFVVKDDIKASQEQIKIDDLTFYNSSNTVALDNAIYEVEILENQSTLDFEQAQVSVTDDVNIEIVSMSSNPLFYVAVILIVIGVVAAIIFIRNRNQKGKFAAITITVIGVALLLITLFNAQNFDVNNDGKVDENDVETLKTQLLLIEDVHIVLPEESDNTNNVSGDINNDGDVNLEDLGELEQEVEKHVLENFDVNLIFSEYYYKKDENITFEIALVNNANYHITQLVVNGEIVQFRYNDFSKLYTVEMAGDSFAGVKTLSIDELTLSNGSTFKDLDKVQIEIIKDEVVMDSFDVTYDNVSKEASITFDIINPDLVAMSVADINVLTDDVNIASQVFTNGTNKVNVPVNTNTIYTVNMDVEYNLDSDTLIQEENHVRNASYTYLFRVLDDGSVQVSTPEIGFDQLYKIDLVNSTIADAAFTSIDKVAKNDIFYLVYDFGIVGNNHPTEVNINGAYYPLFEKVGSEVFQPENNTIIKTYYVEMTSAISGNQTYNAIDIKTSMGFKQEINTALTIEVVKERPTLSIHDITINENTVQANMNVVDVDNAIHSMRYVVYNKENIAIYESNLNITDTTLQIPIENYASGEYTFKIFATESLYQGHSEEIELDSNQFFIENNVDIIDFTVDKTHIEKNDQIVGTVTLTTNTDVEIIGFIINNTIVDATLVNTGIYSVPLQILSIDSGVKNIELTKVIYSDGTKLDVNSITSVEVLKSAISISGMSINEDLPNEQITLEYTLNDNDDAFVNGEIIVTDSSNIVVYRSPINTGLNSHTIDASIGAVYSARIDGQWKKDIDATMQESINLYTHEIGIVANYNFTFTNVYSQNIENENTVYFDKDEIVKLFFTSTNDSVYIPSKITINDNLYTVTAQGENLYSVSVSAPSTAGVHSYVITNVYLENGYQEEENTTYQVDVLKTIPVAQDLRYEVLENGGVRAYIDVNDNSAIQYYSVVVNDGINNIYTNTMLDKNTEYIDFTPSIHNSYSIQVRAVYDLDSNTLTNNENEYDVLLIDETIPLLQEFVEIKDIKELVLYKAIGDTSTIVTNVNVNDLNATDYFVQVSDNYGNVRYADVINHVIKDNQLYLILDIEDSITLQETKQGGTIVHYGGIDDNIASNQTFELFINELLANPNETVVLKNNIDASNYSSTLNYYIYAFNGTIEGNGYTISNLSKPLFYELNNATINNLVITDAYSTNGSLLAVTTKGNTTLTNVHIQDSTLVSGNNTGGLIGQTMDASNSDVIITNSSVTNTSVSGGKWTGGMVGKQYGNLTITNSYVQGSVATSQNATGGILGEAYGNITFDKLYTDITLASPSATYCGGIVGYGGGGSKVISNTFSLATGVDSIDGNRVTGYGWYKLSNIYTLADSTLNNQSGANVTNVTRDDITKEFITDILGFDDAIWDIEGINEVGNMPGHLGINTVADEVMPTSDVKIPNYKYVFSLDTYTESRDIAYHNMNVIMPHLDVETQVRYGNSLLETHLLNTSKIDVIYPVDSSNNLVIGLNKDNQASISKIRIIMENGEIIEYDTTFKKLLDSVAVYTIPELSISYNYPKLVFNNHHETYNEVLNYASNLTYDEISSLTSEEESRLYVDYYNEYFKAKLSNEVLNIFETMPQYTFTNDSQNIINKVKNDLLNDSRLEAILYTANYFDRYYNFDIGIASDMSDVILYGSDLYSDTSATGYHLIDEVLQTSEANRATNKTIDFYNNIIKPKYSNRDVKSFFETYIKELTLSSDADTWFENQFSGIIEERKLEAPELQEVRYSAWDQINMRNHLLIPILSMPGNTQDDMYIISGPTQITFGSLNRYQLYLDGDVEGVRANLSHYADMILAFYENSATYQPNPVHWFNERTNIQYDTRFNFPAGAPTSGTQEFGSSQDPVFKWVNETIQIQGAANGLGAYANGTDVYWISFAAVWSDFSFSVWTHETAHNQDGRYFYDGNWRRAGTGAEDHADYNIAQNMREGHYTPNLRYDFDTSSNISVNIFTDRVHGTDNIHDFYDDMFDAYYMLDYLTAQAFFQLTPSEQSKLVTQVYYNDASGNLHTVASSNTTTTSYVALSPAQLEAMNLKSMQDLWDNRIVFRDAVIFGNNVYESSSHYDILWYHPYNDERVADGTIFKRTSYEMLGVGGIDGRIAYASGQSANDLEAIGNVTGDPTMTWEKYKMSRWLEVENNLETNNYFDSDEVIEKYVTALKADAANNSRNNTNTLRSVLYNAIKHDSEDFDKGSDGFTLVYQQDIITAQQLIDVISNNEWGSYRLMADLDFSDIAVDDSIDAYIANNFVGVIDGNGYSITGLQAAIFNQTNYGHFKNIHFDNIVVGPEDTALLSNTVTNSLIDDIVVSNININLPLFATTEENNVELTPTIYQITNNEIHTIDDLLQIELSTDPLVKQASYKLMDNIDASTLTGNTSIITGTFSGILDGNGYTINNLKKPIFENLTGTATNINIESGTVSVYKTEFGLLANSAQGALISNIKLSNVVFSTTKYEKIGGLVGYVHSSTITNISLNNMTIVGHNEVAGMVGKMYNSTIKNIEAINMNVTLSNFYGGTIVGRVHGTTLQNIVADGVVTTTKTHSGGVAGVLRDGSTLENVISNVQVLKPTSDDPRNSNGGIVGAFETNNGIITNALQLSDVQVDITKIISTENDGQNKINNGYELSDKNGVASTANTVTILTSSDITADFYRNTLGLDETIWDYSTIDTLGYPTIK